MNARDKLRSDILDIIGDKTLVDEKHLAHFHAQKAVHEIMDKLGYEKVIQTSVAKYAHRTKERALIEHITKHGV
ncbi:MAG: hypothetical protein Q3971_03260 [Moraxella sp.]|nr:hypothetical protein [Moraxella sp.]